MKHKWSVLFLVLFLAPIVYADQYIVNSADWRDVYSAMLYGSLQNVKTDFITSANHAPVLLNNIPLDTPITIFTSRSSQYVSSYRNLALSRGYQNVTELTYATMNLDLAELSGADKFIVLDDSYGYNAIAVASYAAKSGSYVLFADAGNIASVDALLNDRNPSSVIIYGQVDREVKDTLAKYAPETINDGNRFENNMAIVDKYQQIAPSQQVVLTNGEFIEQSLISGDDPVLFIGKTNVPDEVRKYINQSDFDVAILIGNELVQSAVTIRRQIGISVFVKFARGSRTPEGPIAQVEDLDRFPMPGYFLNLTYDNVVYNSATKTLEVTYKNNVDLATYFQDTVTILPLNQTVGDAEPVFIDGNDFKTVIYTKTTDDQDISLAEGENTARLFTIYGESPQSLENIVQAELPIQRITVLDDSAIEITDLVYDTTKARFYVTLENTGSVDAYAKPEVVDVLVNDQLTTKSADAVVFLKHGENAKVPVKLKLSSVDIEDNANIKARAYYGVRENSLIKIVVADFAMATVSMAMVYYVIIAVVVCTLLLLIVFRKKCRMCRQKNMFYRKHCKKCKAKL
ncbi:hypothetical protein C4573_04965 [Candidatus Woesearchaeota archaeon]|nr:MAG: hypothetical protein C4573_04965 [Candidatus Woesearchaeota archaeon]